MKPYKTDSKRSWRGEPGNSLKIKKQMRKTKEQVLSRELNDSADNPSGSQYVFALKKLGFILLLTTPDYDASADNGYRDTDIE
ncbi:MAG: hypothetical protein DHS20C01_03410 [marine bacterium B5-7]|nr:MAG: hypothetical protein DHS20C01_03410 [marine bacterium B5-7]